jgi:PAS domain S-box-containing protein
LPRRSGGRQLAKPRCQPSEGDASLLALSEFTTPAPQNDSFRRLVHLLHHATAVEFELYNPAPIWRQVAERMQHREAPDIEQYVRLVESEPAELEALYEAICIPATSFFREPQDLHVLQEKALPELLARRNQGPIRVWVCGCSSGEEVYSLAILLSEQSGAAFKPSGMQIFGTDLRKKVIEQARAGIYPKSSMAVISQERREKFFVKVQGGYQVAQYLRDLCVFAPHDLTRDPPFSQVDLISCRNVLVYMGAELRRRILETLHYALRNTGFLLLGQSESVNGSEDLFKPVDRRTRIFLPKLVAWEPYLGKRAPERRLRALERNPEVLPARRRAVLAETSRERALRLRQESLSRNAELSALNEELQNRTAELAQLADDLSNLLVGVNLPIVVLDEEGLIRRFTPLASHTLNLSALDMGKGFDEAARRLGIRNWHKLLADVLIRQRLVERDVQDRHGHWYSFRMRHHAVGERVPHGVLIALMDIDAVKRSLESTEERLTLAQEATGIGIWDWNLVAGETYCSREWGPLYGLLPGTLALPRDLWLASIHPEDRQRVDRELTEALAGIRRYETEFRVIWPDGSTHWLYGKGRVYRDPAGTAVRMLGLNLDITNRMAVEESLRLSQERFSQFMGHLPAGAFIKDRNSHYLYANPWFERLMGEEPGAWLGAKDEKYWPALVEQLHQEDQCVLKTGNVIAGEKAREMGGNIRYFQTVKFPIPDRSGAPTHVGGVALEISDKVQVERERQALAAKLETAQEEERRRIARELHDGLTQDLAGMAIDLGRLASLAKRAPPIQSRDLLALQRRVVLAAEAARHIAHQLHPAELDDLGLAAALRALCEDFGQQQALALRFAAHLLSDRLPREVASCLYKVTQEALRNVAQHARTRLASVTLAGNSHRVRLRISDRGMGFTVPLLERAAGLGIQSMRERVRLIQGTFSISSHPGKGTDVLVEVPLREAGS